MLTRKFARKKAHRNHMLRNLAASVILYEKVKTTGPKAKEVKQIVDRSITTAKKGSLAARRELQSFYFDSNVVKKLFEVLTPRYQDRTSGYTRTLRLGNRVGDNSEKFLLTLIPENSKIDSTNKDSEPTAKTDTAKQVIEEPTDGQSKD